MRTCRYVGVSFAGFMFKSEQAVSFSFLSSR